MQLVFDLKNEKGLENTTFSGGFDKIFCQNRNMPFFFMTAGEVRLCSKEHFGAVACSPIFSKVLFGGCAFFNYTLYRGSHIDWFLVTSQ